LSDTIGKLMTEPKYDQEQSDEDQKSKESYQISDLKYDLQAIDIQRELHSRFAFNSSQGKHSFYAGGKVYPIEESSLELAQYLTKQRQYSGKELQTFSINKNNEKLLLNLWQDGHLFSGE